MSELLSLLATSQQQQQQQQQQHHNFSTVFKRLILGLSHETYFFALSLIKSFYKVIAGKTC